MNLYKGTMSTINSYTTSAGGTPITPSSTGENPENRIDFHFKAMPQNVQRTDAELVWDMLVWFMNFDVTATIYYRYIDENQNPVGLDGSTIDVPWIQAATNLYIPANGFTSMARNVWGTTPDYEKLSTMLDPVPGADSACREQRREYAIHLDSVNGITNKSNWTQENVTMRISVVTGNVPQLRPLAGGNTGTVGSAYETSVGGADQARAIEWPSPFTMSQSFNDDQVPSINTSRGVRLVSRDDQTAKVNLWLTGPGQVTYLAIPVTYVEDPTTNQATTNLDEAILKTVGTAYTPMLSVKELSTDNDPPSLVRIPLLDNDLNKVGSYPGDSGYTGTETDMIQFVESPRYSDFNEAHKASYEAQGIQWGQTDRSDREDGLHTINLTDLEANTLYILCMIPSGLSAAYGPDTPVYCYRFTTETEDVPKLEVSGLNQPTINFSVESGTSAYMYWYLILQGAEDRGSSKPMYYETFANIATSDFVKSPYYDASMTALDAMNTRVNSGGYQGTLFDLYAQEGLKDDYRDLILDNVGGMDQSIIAGGSGNTAVFLNNSTEIDMSQLPRMLGGTTTYTLIAMAKRTQDSQSYSFAAWFPISKSLGSPPMLISAIVDGDVEQMEDAAGNFTGVKSADILLTFSGDLYNWVNGAAHPVDNCGLGIHTTDPMTGTDSDGNTIRYYSVGAAAGRSGSGTVSIVGESTHGSGNWESPTRTIRLHISNISGSGAGGSITFQYLFTNANGAGSSRQFTPLQLVIRAQKDADGNYWPVITNTPAVNTSTSAANPNGWVEAGVEWNLTKLP